MKGLKCICGSVAVPDENLSINGYPIAGWKCKKCGEEDYNPEKTEKILLRNKLKKHKFHLRLSQVKSNLIIRIPKEVSTALDLKKGCEVEFRLKKDDEITISPL